MRYISITLLGIPTEILNFTNNFTNYDKLYLFKRINAAKAI